LGKRSDFPRREKDWYATPYSAVLPLLPHLAPRTRFAEPCVGDGALVRHLERHGHTCYWGSDIEDRSAPVDAYGVEVIKKYPVADALTLTTPLKQAGCIITNPPYDKSVLFPMIDHFAEQNTTFLLLNADFMHNVGSGRFLRRCSMIISIGRIKWIAGSKNGGMENFAWFRFDQKHEGPTEFFGRAAS